ncbi:MAG: SGNH/GDSL hydrolase family protein [Planctomycetota bacterium]|jgi:hypothetical protein
MESASKNNIRIKNITVLFLSIIFSIFLFEIGMRMFFPNLHITNNWAYHSILGWSQVPNAKYEFKLEQKYLVHVEFNSLGFRDVEHKIEKPYGVKRIAVIGDSFCESVQVNLTETFYKQLEKLLNRNGNGKWEVLNFGVGDFGTTQEWITLNKYALKYSPDIILHQIFPLNDICNNTVELFGMCKSYNDRYRPYFIQSRNGFKLSSAQPVRNFVRRNLISYNIVERIFLDSFGFYKQFANDEFRNNLIKEKGLPALDPLLYTYVDDDEQIDQIKNGWKITEEIIEKIITRCRKSEIPYVGIVVPFEMRVNRSWNVFASGQPSPKMIQYYPEKRLGELFRRLDVNSVMLIETFQKNENIVLPYRDGHLNPEGHKLTAEAILQVLHDRKLIEE